MSMRGGISLAVFLVLITFFAHSTLGTGDAIVITRADRKIDLQSHNVRIQISLKVENNGDAAVTQVLVPGPGEISASSPHLAFSSVSLVEGKAKAKTYQELPIQPSPGSEGEEFIALLPSPLPKGSTLSLEAYYVLTGVLVPFPAEITQFDPQLVQYHGSHYLPSSYPVTSQSTVIRLPSSSLESYTPLPPSKKANSEIKLGPYTNTPPHSSSLLTVHYENNKAFTVVKSLEREVEVSHWGNVYITENYELFHAGAKHQGGFSRLDFQARPESTGRASLRAFLAVLPARAHSIYFRDEIGNISSTNVRADAEKTEVEIQPRYPLLGGWSSTFTLGYSVPLESLVHMQSASSSSSSPPQRFLNLSFGSPIGDVVIERMVNKVILPEGSSSISAQLPFPAEQALERRFSYLDTVGRPTLVLTKDNVVPEHGAKRFQVLYSFSSPLVLVEPLLLILAFSSLFLLAMVAVRTDLTLATSAPSYVEKQKAQQLTDLLQRLHSLLSSSTSSSISSSSAALLSLGRTGDVAEAKAAKKGVDGEGKRAGEESKALAASAEGLLPPPATLKLILAAVSKAWDVRALAAQKLAAAIEVYEKQGGGKEADARIAPIQAKLVAASAELRELLAQVDC